MQSAYEKIIGDKKQLTSNDLQDIASAISGIP